MKLFRFGYEAHEMPGVLINDKKYSMPGFHENYDEAFFHTNGLHRLHDYLDKHLNDLVQLPETERIGPCICRPSKIVCIGLNYSDHAAEANMKLPKEPILFLKSTSAITAPFESVIMPKNGTKLDWEVELAVVISKKARYVTEEQAMNHVAGFGLMNDYSERAFQLEREGQWVKGKSCDTFAPLGPYLVTPDEITDINDLKIWLSVNGKMMQEGNTNNLIFKIPFLIHYVSQFMTLLPGDIISTGTPAGVGMGKNPPTYLKQGDIVEYGIDHLGTARQVIKNYQ